MSHECVSKFASLVLFMDLILPIRNPLRNISPVNYSDSDSDCVETILEWHPYQPAMRISAGESFEECMEYFMPNWIPSDTDIDAMQALDSSGSVGFSGFRSGKSAAKKMNKLIDIFTANGITGNLSGSRSGFIQFASLWNTEIKIHLPDHDNLEDLNDDIATQVYTGGATAIAKALNLTGQEFDVNSEPTRNKRVMLITDGYENQGGDPVHEANVLKDDYDAEICVIAVGNNPNLVKLKGVASHYNHRHCICGTENWRKLKRGMIKAVKKLKPVIKQRRKNRRIQLKQQV